MRHVVQQGEDIYSIADRYGVSADEIWNDSGNAALRERRDGPHMLAPGDVVEVPEPRAGGHVVQPGGHHAHRAQQGSVWLRLKLLDTPYDDEGTVEGDAELSGDDTTMREPEARALGSDAPLANTPYRLEVAGRTTDGRTDGEGLLVEPIPASAGRARLVLEPGTEHERSLDVRIGHLDPIEEVSGQRQRLSNQGYQGTGRDGLALAIAEFQRRHGLTPSGEMDDDTRSRLRDASGS